VEGRGSRKPHDQGAGTPEGIPAFRQLISEGINVTSRCFSRSPYTSRLQPLSSMEWSASPAVEET